MNSNENPFTIQTPDRISAEETVQLFVNVFTDFYNIPRAGHTFINGHRGSGKSMMFRYMLPDCQQIVSKKRIKDLDYFAIYIPIKNTDLNISELDLVENPYVSLFLNEHFLVLHMLSRIFFSLSEIDHIKYSANDIKLVQNFYKKDITDLIKKLRWDKTLPKLKANTSPKEIFNNLKEFFEDNYRDIQNYIRMLFLSTNKEYYSGPYTTFLDFLLPIIKAIRKLKFLPDGPIYLLIDDADNLNYSQTLVLNTWVSKRTTRDVCLKISTQLNYQTFMTTSGGRIENPHDYSEVNISSVYTSSKSKYRKRVYDIVKKRFIRFKINSTPEQFFPEDEHQKSEIIKIENEIRENYPTRGRGYSVYDDVYRYARPEYIKRLQGKRKAGSKYSYSGFDQLVNISSGIVRDFLEPAAKMYGEVLSLQSKEEKKINYIDPGLQSKIIKEYSYDFIFSEFNKIINTEKEYELNRKTKSNDLEDLPKLRNLIDALGKTFHKILVSNASERRVFSIALSDQPDDLVQKILRLGVKHGYFHQSTIGTKDGAGRTWLYILSRRLAPNYKLDPTSFAGYKFVTNQTLREMIGNPNRFLNKISKKGVDNTFEEPNQLLLFEE